MKEQISSVSASVLGSDKYPIQGTDAIYTNRCSCHTEKLGSFSGDIGSHSASGPQTCRCAGAQPDDASAPLASPELFFDRDLVFPCNGLETVRLNVCNRDRVEVPIRCWYVDENGNELGDAPKPPARDLPRESARDIPRLRLNPTTQRSRRIRPNRVLVCEWLTIVARDSASAERIALIRSMRDFLLRPAFACPSNYCWLDQDILGLGFNPRTRCWRFIVTFECKNHFQRD